VKQPPVPPPEPPPAPPTEPPPDLFAPVTLKGMVLPDRFVRSATWEGMAEADGSPSAALIDLLARLGRAGVGLVITGHAFVHPQGRMGLRQLGVHSDALVEPLAKLVAATQEAGAKIALQITHAGLWAADAPGTEVPVGPSPRPTVSGPVGRALTIDEIETLPEVFAAAARRARAAGFDAVQLHAAHGYLLSSFISPFFNRRDDAYGGDVVRRHRLVVEVVRAVREAVGADYPILIKLNAADFVEGGLTEAEMLEGAVLLEEAGADAIELSGGTALSGDYRPIRSGRAVAEGPEVYYAEAALKLKQRVRLPVILVGGIRRLEVAQRVVAEGVADLVSLSRPLICEPELLARWRSGDGRRAACRSCNRCYFRWFGGEVVRCVNKKVQQEVGVPG
jgi:2,4-dienoyl-CoA reductase-like NADH-dependent reductase (Old Yellow Enzyme family)